MISDDARLTTPEPARQHTWMEDGAMFAVTEYASNVHLTGPRLTGGMITSNEAVLAREVLRLHDIIDRVNALTTRIEEAASRDG